MRRGRVVVLVLLLAVLGAACDPELSRKASGTFSGSSSFEFGTHGCSFVYQEFEGTWIRRQGALGGTFLLTGCVTTNNEGGFSYTGTFLMVTQGGAELRGSVRGENDGTTCPVEVEHVMTLRSGTKRFAGATGTIIVDGVWDCTVGPFQGPNPYNGTITAAIESDLQTRSGARIAL
jgi:hypothetical protein